MSDEIKRAWDIALNTRMGAGRTLGRPLSEQVQEHQLEGIVHAPGSFAPRQGPVVAKIKCPDGAVWVIDYDEQSPYHAFVGRRIMASGFPCNPPQQHVISVTGHFAVSTIRLAEVAPDAWLIEVRAAQDLVGRFELGTSDAAESALSFVTDKGDTFHLANNPAGATVGGLVNALAYPVQLSPCVSRSPQQSLWVICPWSYAQLGALRKAPNGGLPSNVYVDAESGQVRCRLSSLSS